MTRTKLQLPKHFEFSTEIFVRINDINYGGHLGNDSVLSIIHEARVRFLKNFSFSEFDIGGVGIIMSDTVIIYKTEAFYGDILKIDVAVDNVEKYGCDFFYKISNKISGKEIVRAKTGIVFYDYKNKTISKIPEVFVNCIKDIK